MAETLNELLSANVTTVEIIPGTTPTLVFDVKSDLITKTTNVRLDVVQNGLVVLQTSSINITGTKAIYTFTQDETYQFREGIIRTQLHGITSDDIAWKSKIIEIKVGESLTNTTINRPYGV